MYLEVVYDTEDHAALLIEGFGPNTIVGAVKDLVHEDGLHDGDRKVASILISEEPPPEWKNPPPQRVADE